MLLCNLHWLRLKKGQKIARRVSHQAARCHFRDNHGLATLRPLLWLSPASFCA
jgi:hypothetical protein